MKNNDLTHGRSFLYYLFHTVDPYGLQKDTTIIAAWAILVVGPAVGLFAVVASYWLGYENPLAGLFFLVPAIVYVIALRLEYNRRRGGEK